MLETSAVSATFKLRGHEDPNELWPGVEIEPTTAEATNQYYVNAIAPMAVRLGVWPGIPLEAQGTGSGKSNLEGCAAKTTVGP